MENFQKYFIETHDFNPEEWKKELTQWLTEVVVIYMKYYSTGKLEKIYVGADEAMNVVLTIDGKEAEVDLDVYKFAEEECERSRQRECYFANEAMVMEFCNFGEELCHPVLEEVMKEVSGHFGVPYELEYFAE